MTKESTNPHKEEPEIQKIRRLPQLENKNSSSIVKTGIVGFVMGAIVGFFTHKSLKEGKLDDTLKGVGLKSDKEEKE